MFPYLFMFDVFPRLEDNILSVFKSFLLMKFSNLNFVMYNLIAMQTIYQMLPAKVKCLNHK